MAVKSLHQFFYYHIKYLNSMKCREISMGPSSPIYFRLGIYPKTVDFKVDVNEQWCIG
jgi:hypothetical protein